MGAAPEALKRLLVGRPRPSGDFEHTLLPKVIALPVFSSDAMSSVAYATQEILFVLGVAGVAALGHVFAVSVAVAALLAIVVISYQHTVHAYPNGGGAYIVAHENLGVYPGLLAGSALMIDYVMTVSVSMVAGVDAIVSAAQSMRPFKVVITIAFIVLVTIVNLRGTKESGTFFAIPTYGFILAMILVLATGAVRCLGGCPVAESAGETLRPESALGILLIFKAFAAGTTALTGVEAISNGVPAFRYPQSKNAATTLTMMAGISISMFLGTSLLASHMHIVYTETSVRTVLAQIALGVFGGGPLFYFVQVMTAAILILAANTAYQGFPKLTSILAQDRYMPRQFMNRGDRLVFSNGVVILALLASLLVYIFNADLNRLIQLYLVGVFVSFTLSQSGMVVHWRNSKERGWKWRAGVNGFGALATGVVLLIVIQSKFTGGAWLVVVAMPLLIMLMRSIHRHYMEVGPQLRSAEREPKDRRPAHQHMVILATEERAANARAIGYAMSSGCHDVEAVTFDGRLGEGWPELAPGVPLHVFETNGSRVTALRNHLRAKRGELSSSDFCTLVMPEVLKARTLTEIVRDPRATRLKASLLAEPDVQVMDMPMTQEEVDNSPLEVHEPGRNYVCVLVSGVHNATRQAIEYAETLRPTDIRGVNFGLDPKESEHLGDQWLKYEIPHPLEIEDSPFRDIGSSLTHYIRQFKADGTHRVVTIVIPEFITPKRRHRLLHNQTALTVKSRMLLEEGVVVVSVPYHLRD